MARHWLRITKETTYNAGPMSSPTLNTDQIWLDYGTNPPVMNQSPVMFEINSVVPKRGVVKRSAGADQYDVNGSFGTLLYHEQAGFWANAVLQPSLLSGNLPYLPSYTIDRAMINNGNLTWTDRFTGCMFQSATINGSNEGARAPVSLGLQVIGSTRTTVPATPAFNAPDTSLLPIKAYRWNNSTFSLGGTNINSILRSWAITITHNLTTRKNVGPTVNAIRYNGWKPVLSATWDTDAWDYRTKFLSLIGSQTQGQYSTSTLTLADGVTTGSTVFTLANLMIAGLQENTPIADFYTQNATLEPIFDSTNLDLTAAYTAGTVITP